MLFTQCHLLDTGYCMALDGVLHQGDGWKPVQCHCLIALLYHPVEGWGLWDAGYAPRLWTATRFFPYRFYRWATPLPKQPDASIVSQLPSLGLAAGDIRWMVLSHLHGDHTGGMRDFPAARLHVSRAAYDYAAGLQGLQAVRKGYLTALFPDDFADRAVFIEPFNGPPLGALGPTFDLFGDGAAQIVKLPGHARGQVGMLAHSESGPILFAADSILHRASLRDRRPPGALTRIIADDARQIQPTIDRLAAFACSRPEVRVIPTHCSEAYQEMMGSKP